MTPHTAAYDDGKDSALRSAALRCAVAQARRKEHAAVRSTAGALLILGASLVYWWCCDTIRYLASDLAAGVDGRTHELSVAVVLTVASVTVGGLGVWMVLRCCRPLNDTALTDRCLVDLANHLSGDEFFECERSIEEYIHQRFQFADRQTAMRYLRVLPTAGGMGSLQFAAQICTGRIPSADGRRYDETVRAAAADCAERVRRRLAHLERTQTLLRPAPADTTEALLRPADSAAEARAEALLRPADQ